MKYIETVEKKIEELKKNDIVLFYGYKFKVLEDAKCLETKETIYGGAPYEISMPIKDRAWGASCKIINGENCKDGLLKNYDWFQGNSRATQLVIV